MTVTWSMLAGLTADQRQDLLSAARPTSLAAGETLFDEGDPGDAMYLIAGGQLAVLVAVVGSDQRATVRMLGPGDVVGEMALVTEDACRSATVQAVSDVEMFAVTRAQFAQLEEAGLPVADLMFQLLLARATRLSGQLVEALVVPVGTRVARRLVEVVESSGLVEGEAFPVTAEALVSLTGGDYGTVKLRLGELMRCRAVRCRGEQIVLRDRSALRTQAGFD